MEEYTMRWLTKQIKKKFSHSTKLLEHPLNRSNQIKCSPSQIENYLSRPGSVNDKHNAKVWSHETPAIYSHNYQYVVQILTAACSSQSPLFLDHHSVIQPFISGAVGSALPLQPDEIRLSRLHSWK